MNVKKSCEQSTLVDGLQLVHLMGGATGTLRRSRRAHPLAAFNRRLLMGFPQGRSPPLQRCFHCILRLATVGLIWWLPWENGRSSLAGSDVFVAYSHRGVIQQLRKRRFMLRSTITINKINKPT